MPANQEYTDRLASASELHPQYDSLRKSLDLLRNSVREYIGIGFHDGENYHFNTIADLAEHNLLDPPVNPLLGNMLMEEVLSSWKSSDYSYRTPFSWNMHRVKETPFWASILNAIEQRMAVPDLDEDDKQGIENAVIGQENLALLKKFVLTYPEELGRFHGWRFEQTSQEFQNSVYQLILTVDSEKIRPRTLIKAHLAFGDTHKANEILSSLIKQNPHANDLPEIAAACGNPKTGLLLLMLYHSSRMHEANYYTHGWTAVGEATAIADAIERNAVAELTTYFLSPGDSSPTTQQVFPDDEETNDDTGISGLVSWPDKNGNSALMLPSEFDRDMAALYFYAGYTKAKEGQEEGLGFLQGMVDRFKTIKRGDLLARMARLDYPEIALNAAEALSEIDPEKAKEVSLFILRSFSDLLAVSDLVKVFRGISIVEKRPPNIEQTINKLLENGRLEEALEFLLAADQMTVTLRSQAKIEQEDDLTGLSGKYFMTITDALADEKQSSEMQIILDYLTSVNRGKSYTAFYIAQKLGQDGLTLEIAGSLMEGAIDHPFSVLNSLINNLAEYMNKSEYRKTVYDICMAGLEYLAVTDSRGNSIDYDSIPNILAMFMLAEFPVEEGKVSKILRRCCKHHLLYFQAKLAAFSKNQPFIDKVINNLKKTKYLFGLTVVAVGQGNQNLLQETFSKINMRKDDLREIIRAYSWVERTLNKVYL